MAEYEGALDLDEGLVADLLEAAQTSGVACSRRFPYGLFYGLIDGQVVVVACFHAKRSPRMWRSRY